MLTIDKKILIFNVKEVHFSDRPFDIKNYLFNLKNIIKIYTTQIYVYSSNRLENEND